jgi:hypothetical protein
MTITLFVEPKSLTTFIQITSVLKNLPIENDYHFNPIDLVFTEFMVSNWNWINMEVGEYLKLKYCIGKLTSN